MDNGFSFVDVDGNSLTFDRFHYQFSKADNYHDANWLCCNISLKISTLGERNSKIRVDHSVDGFLLTDELQELTRVLRSVLAGEAGDRELTFSPLEPYIDLALSRQPQNVNVLARLDLRPAIGPVIEYCLSCRYAEIEITLADVERVSLRFPNRGETA